MPSPCNRTTTHGERKSVKEFATGVATGAASDRSNGDIGFKILDPDLSICQ